MIPQLETNFKNQLEKNILICLHFSIPSFLPPRVKKEEPLGHFLIITGGLVRQAPNLRAFWKIEQK